MCIEPKDDNNNTLYIINNNALKGTYSSIFTSSRILRNHFE